MIEINFPALDNLRSILETEKQEMLTLVHYLEENKRMVATDTCQLNVISLQLKNAKEEISRVYSRIAFLDKVVNEMHDSQRQVDRTLEDAVALLRKEL